MIINYYILASGTIFIILFSWFLSIKFRRYHGIARFFSFESIFILILLNYGVWFSHPFSLLQIISWIFLSLSAYILGAGYLTLKKKGRPGTNFENTSVLVRSGIYSYIRHPLYLSLLLLGTGIMLKRPGAIQIFLGFINMVAVYVTARIEEQEMTAKFNEDYRSYMKDSKMFIPHVI